MEEEVAMEAEEYYYMLQELYLDESQIDLENDFKARASLVRLKRLKSDVKDLRLQITQDTRIIRNMYLDESVIDKSKIMGLFRFQKKLTPTQKRKKLIIERERSLVPYKEIIELIDLYIQQIEDMEKYIQNEALDEYSTPKYTKLNNKK